MRTTTSFNGLDITEEPKITTYSRNGTTQRRTFKGKEADILTMANILTSAGYEVTITQGPLYKLEALISAEVSQINEEQSVIWELDNQIETKELLQANTVPVIAALPGSYKRYIAKLFREVEDKDNAEFVLPPNKDVAYTNSQNQDAVVVWNLLCHGTETVEIVLPVLKRVLNVNSNYYFTNYNRNIGRIYSTQRLISDEHIPNNYADVLPNDSDPNFADTDGLFFIYGWKKSPTQVSQVSLNRNQVVQSWSYGLWPKFIFGDKLV